MRDRLLRRTAVLLLLVISLTLPGSGYSVLTHEEVIDLLWLDQIRPLLLKRFPGTTDDDLRKAHAYAYGGCMIQDMGYYPFGNKYFSDLSHYVRSGDFVETLMEESSDLYEYAFALGALAHYASDTTGHPTVNHIVALEFPKLQKKFGNEVTYAQDPKAHIRAEFGLDIVQVAKGRFSSDQYHDFIGFEVSKPLLQRAFAKTYGISTDDVFPDIDLAIGTYRRSISKVIPAMTKAALLTHRAELVKETPNFDKKKFLFYMSRAHYERHWGKGYRKPGIGTRILAFFLKFVPKIGPFRALSFKTPPKQAEDLYVKSVNNTVEDYRAKLLEAQKNKVDLPNIDFDTGRPTLAGEYVLTDKTYAHLLDDLAKKDFKPVTPELRANILQFFSNANAPIAIKRNPNEWQKIEQELAQLKAYVPQNAPPENPVKPATEPSGQRP
ncbi:MAG: hypothetical protein DMG68_01475 [Acidobacteria bacterium]|nr:MAG: hypothetical protein DMG68_01475 [Acidobacteriota bacterium]